MNDEYPKLNTADFESTLYNDCKNAFTKIISENEGVYVIGLYHFGGWDGVMPLYNTLNDLNTVRVGLGSCGDIEASKIQELRVKWNPSDFLSLEGYSEYFDDSERSIQSLGSFDCQSAEISHGFWLETLNAMARVLTRLDEDGVFSTNIERNQLTVYIATYDESYGDSYSRVLKLNPPDVINRVSKEFEYMISQEERWIKEALDEVSPR